MPKSPLLRSAFLSGQMIGFFRRRPHRHEGWPNTLSIADFVGFFLKFF